MDQPDPGASRNLNPGALPAIGAQALQLQAWHELHDQMQRLHAELEYIRLMLKLQSAPR